MNNGINLAFLAQAPSAVSQSSQAAPQGSPSGNQLFANLLMQKMSPAGTLADNNGDQSALDFPADGLSSDDLAALSNFLNTDSGNSSLRSLISSIKSQFGKGSATPSFDAADSDNSSTPDPMLAAWLASLAALQQQQPKPQDAGVGVQPDPAAKLLAGIQSQLGGSAADQRILKALEQAFKKLNDQTSGLTKADSSNTDTAQKFAVPAAPSPIVEATPVPQAQPAQPIPILPGKAPATKTDAVTAHQPVAEDLPKVAENPAPKVDLPRAESKAQNLAPAATATQNADRSQQVQATAAPVPGDTKSDGHNQTGQGTAQGSSDSRSSDDSRKNASPDPASAKFTVQGPSGSVTSPTETSVAAGALQPVTRNVIADQNHNSPAPAGAPATAVREAMHVDAMEAPAAPRSVNQASLMQAASQAEMRVSVKTESAGTMDVRAVLEGNHISATIAAQHGATRDWLVANVHDLNQSLSRDDLKLRTFEVTDSSMQGDLQRGSTGNQGQPDAQKPQQYFQNRKDSVFTDSFRSEDVETETSASPQRALSLLA